MPISLFNNGGTILLFIAGCLIFFLFIREILTWYWKIDKMIEILEQIEENTRPRKIIKESSEEPKIRI